MTKKSNKKIQEETKDLEKSDPKEYGVVLTKEKKYRHKIYPQKGKVPEEDDTYKIV